MSIHIQPQNNVSTRVSENTRILHHYRTNPITNLKCKQ